MSIRNLEHLFNPASVAVIGASNKPRSVGATVLRNLIEGGFKGPIYPVNPNYEMLDGLKTYAGVADLPETPQLAVICTPPGPVPGIVGELGARGCKAAIILTAGLDRIRDGQGRSLRQATLAAARPYLLRILGPNCVGLLVPRIGLNASFAHTGALPGTLAFVSQSGALVTGVLDWARSRAIGFSSFVSMGECADLDFGDMLDYLAADGATRAILMFMEDTRHARKFMSAARAAARSKPVLVIKAGRAPEGARAAALHTGALAGSDRVYDAAIRRAGMLRVATTEELFGAVETLGRARSQVGERLTIVTNGGGPGVMAADALSASAGHLAPLAPETVQKLDSILPPAWSRANPIDILGDASAERYLRTMEVLLKDPQSDAILFIHAPTAIVSSTDIANAIVPLAKNVSRNIIACWLGGEAVAAAGRISSNAGIPTYDTPENAVRAFMQMVQYRRNQSLLMQVPASLPDDFKPDRGAARAIVRDVLASGRHRLSVPEARALLAAYRIPVAETRIAMTVDEAVETARRIGYPVAIKILSPDIRNKSDIGGVVLDLDSDETARAAAQAMLKRLQELRADIRLSGFIIQPMVRRPGAQELLAGVTTDPVFGPVILFGQGGIAIDAVDDHAVALPPLNMVLARDLISRTRLATLLEARGSRAAADSEAVCRVLVQLSHLVTDIGEIVELDINPLLVDARGVIALDAQVCVAPADDGAGIERLAIRPYPKELEETVDWQGEQVVVRPIRPEDGEAHLEFFRTLNPADVRLRAFIRINELSPSQLARLTQIDYDREMAFIAVGTRPDGGCETLGVARAIADPDNQVAEFAIIVRSDLKGRGLGRILMRKLIDYCRRRGLREIVGEALPHNRGLLELAKQFGFEVRPEDGSMLLRLVLR
ncbi:MAG: family N-acetyltransferase [Herminiimonas sp.]|nr:family N-acetyltransferase [Herminiimonas sp.]